MKNTPFLELVAENVLSNYQDSLKDLLLVFPNRRSVLYFNMYLSKKVAIPVWAPRCTTISEFIQSFTTLKKADNLQLLFELHQVYCKTRPSTEAFDSFYYWGEVMLSDFDDMDKYMVHVELLFKNVAALKNITDDYSFLDLDQIEAIKRFWGTYAEARQSKHRQEFTDIWTSMPKVYENFKERLNQMELAYEGMIYRQVAELFLSQNPPQIDAQKIAFIGFNALNKCEKSIFQFFQKQNQAIFYWDFEPEYLENKHEAGFFIKDNLVNFPQTKGFSLHHENQEKARIELISLPSQVGQAKIVSQLLEKEDFSQPEKTAILLSDENLLMPVLHALPKELGDINITMGYLVKNASLASLLDSLGKLYQNVKQSNNQNLSFYYKYVVETLTHPYILKSDPDKIPQLIKDIFRLNRIYIDPAYLSVNPLLKLIFRKVDHGKDYILLLRELLQYLALNFPSQTEHMEDPAGVETESLSSLYIAINKFSETIHKIEADMDLKLCVRILKKVVSGLTVPFEGEPLKGIQLMGFLESRALDFENLIILGVNEGNLPKNQAPVSFIPYNLRKGFELPTPEYRDAMYAYYFYRIISRAKKASLVYNSATGSMGAAEVSRYVTQILYSGRYNIVQKVQTFNIVPAGFPVLEIKKTDAILTKLNEYTTSNNTNNYLSPSALTTYIECPMRFYFKYIEGLKEFEEPGEEIDPAVFGSVLHSAMNAIYKNYIQQELKEEHLKQLLQNKEILEKECLKALDDTFLHTGLGENLVPEGRNYLIFRILVKYIRQIVQFDISQAPFTLLGLEEKIVSDIAFNQKNEKKQLKIGGIIDRIDQNSSGTRIIDYKTGKPEISFNSIEELFVADEKHKYKKEIFQTLLYCILYKKMHETNYISPSLYITRSLFDMQFDPQIKMGKDKLQGIDVIETEFLERLQNLIEEIFNIEVPFHQTTRIDSCNYCAFRKICNR